MPMDDVGQAGPVRNRVSGVVVLDRSMALLELLGDGPRSLRSLAQASGLPRPTAHRLLVALESHGLAERGPDGAFRLGPRLTELALRARHGLDLGTLAPGVLARLHDQTGESGQLYLPSGRPRPGRRPGPPRGAGGRRRGPGARRAGGSRRPASRAGGRTLPRACHAGAPLVAGGARVTSVVAAVQGDLDGLQRPLGVVGAVGGLVPGIGIRHGLLLTHNLRLAGHAPPPRRHPPLSDPPP